ncbi:hypothetical protein E2C01_013847 [Portunus trituberculatus]|uniref:Uncharacterized protein n=1 Tax=Portunus trituberculatus TaxID=210409 RepID=A0A5B7DIE6_PORTR|nr:hypothetical protein [Portunus trituberculatus]
MHTHTHLNGTTTKALQQHRHHKDSRPTHLHRLCGNSGPRRRAARLKLSASFALSSALRRPTLNSCVTTTTACRGRGGGGL